METKINGTLAKTQSDDIGAIRNRIRKEMKSQYKVPNIAFAEIDFNGNGFVEEEDLIMSLTNFRLPYTKEEVQNYFKVEKLFSRFPDGKMPYELFKKEFFPKAAGVGAADESQEDELQLDHTLDPKTKSDIVVTRMK